MAHEQMKQAKPLTVGADLSRPAEEGASHHNRFRSVLLRRFSVFRFKRLRLSLFEKVILANSLMLVGEALAGLWTKDSNTWPVSPSERSTTSAPWRNNCVQASSTILVCSLLFVGWRKMPASACN